MKWEVEKAKNQQLTLKINDYYVYSKYRPYEDAEKFINSNTNTESDYFILLGLGLGYHLAALKKLVPSNKISVLLLDKNEQEFYLKYCDRSLINDIKLITITEISNIEKHENIQFLVPISIINSLDSTHELKEIFDEVKLKEMSYRLVADRMSDNFIHNISLNNLFIKNLKGLFTGQTACLVSSGPSIDEMMPYLKQNQNKVFILSVSSAVRILEKYNIQPHATVLSDAKERVQLQFKELSYQGPLFYLATACKEVLANYIGKKYILFQKGYDRSEQYAAQLEEPTFDVGGSVAILGFLLLEYLGFERIVLCGQDLGFRQGKTHSIHTTSGMHLSDYYKYGEVEANNGQKINISKSLKIYHNWFENKIKKSNIEVYNTAYLGAKIKGAPYIDLKKFNQLILENDSKILQKKLEVFET